MPKYTNRLKHKSHYENVPFEVPEGWCWCTLDDLAFYKKGPFGSSLTKSMFVLDSPLAYKVYEQKNAIQKDHTLGSYFIDENKYKELSGFKVEPSDIIVSCAGTIGETYVMPCDIREGIINQALMLIRLHLKDIQDFYLLYFDFILKAEAAKESKGTAIKNIPPFDVLKSFFIPIPPLAEQGRILEEINKLMSFVDSIEVSTKDISSLITSAKSKILNLAIHGKLVPQDANDEPASELLKRINPKFVPCDNPHYEQAPFEIPDNWVWVRIDEINKFKSKSVNPQNYPTDQFELYSVPTFETGNPEFPYGKDVASSKVEVEEGDVLLCKINPHLNRVWVVRRRISQLKSLASSEWIVIRTDKIMPEYLAITMQSPYFRELMMSNVSGVGGSLMRAQPTFVKQYMIPIPPIREQKRIVAKIQEAFNMLDSIAESLN